MARSTIFFALLVALIAAFALSAHATADPECPAFRRCAPRSDVFGFRRASDKEGTVLDEAPITWKPSLTHTHTHTSLSTT